MIVVFVVDDKHLTMHLGSLNFSGCIVCHTFDGLFIQKASFAGSIPDTAIANRLPQSSKCS